MRRQVLEVLVLRYVLEAIALHVILDWPRVSLVPLRTLLQVLLLLLQVFAAAVAASPVSR